MGAVSAEIEKLQARSTTLNLRLKNRQEVERLLGPAVEEFSISPFTIQKICEGAVDEQWVAELMEVERRFEAVQKVSSNDGSPLIKAVEDLRPLFRDLINKVLYFVLSH